MVSKRLVVCWSPKGGAGCSVFAAALAADIGRAAGEPEVVGSSGRALLVDVSRADDLAGVIGLGSVGEPGDVVDVTAGLSFMRARGVADLPVDLERYAAVVVDVGAHPTSAGLAWLEEASDVIGCIRSHYLDLRAATRAADAARVFGWVVLEPDGASLGERDVSSVTGAPVLARIPVRALEARAVDAGVILSRMPDRIGRAASALRVQLRIGVAVVTS